MSNEVEPAMQSSRAARLMPSGVSLIALLIAVAGLPMIGMSPLSSASAQHIERSFAVEAGERLDIDLRTGGDIVVTGWDRNEVAVSADVRGRDAEYVEVDVEEFGSGVRIRSDAHHRSSDASVYIEVQVPKRFDVDLSTMGGDVTLENIEGEFQGRTMGGALSLVRLTGRAELTTMGGDITVRESALDGKVHTMGGRVEIEDVSGGLEGSTMGGEVSYRNVDRAGARSGDSKEVSIKTMGGDINVDDAPAGARLHTMGGDIIVRDALDHVDAETMGGEIVVYNIDGWVEAVTMGGNIEVTMTGDPDRGDRHIELRSMGGDVELTVPDGLSMDIDIELAYTRRYSGRYSIHSDFDLKIEESGEWDDDDGEPRRYIYGTAAVGGGEHRIRIKTTNGDIYLRRGS